MQLQVGTVRQHLSQAAFWKLSLEAEVGLLGSPALLREQVASRGNTWVQSSVLHSSSQTMNPICQPLLCSLVLLLLACAGLSLLAPGRGSPWVGVF